MRFEGPTKYAAVTGIAAVALAAVAVAVEGAHPPEGAAAVAPSTVMTIYFGTTHAHTGAHNDHGQDESTPGEVFAAARDAHHDFVFLTEHSGHTGPRNPEEFYDEAVREAAAATEEGEFVGLAGYEFSDNNGDDDADSGHMTGFGTAEFVDAMAPGWDFAAFQDYLVAQAEDRPVFGGFNHPPATGHPGATEHHLTPERRQVVALSETANGASYRPDEEAEHYEAFVRHLDEGWRVAPTCGLDSHGLLALEYGESADKEPCRTGLLAPALTTEGVVAAVVDRRVYSTRDVDLRTKYSANGAWMGSVIGTPEHVSFTISAKDRDTGEPGDRIRRIEVVGEGGTVLAAEEFDAHRVRWQPTVPARGNSYMFVRVFTGEHQSHTAVLAPVWLE